MVAAKAVGYAATFGATGGIFFLGYSDALLQRGEHTVISRWVRWSSALALLAGGAQILVTAGSMGGDAAGMRDGALLHMVWHAGQGWAVSMRAAGLLIAASALWIWDRAAPTATTMAIALAMVGAALAATSFAWVGHAHSLSPDFFPVAMLCVHLLAVAFWLGALIPLLLVTRRSDALGILVVVLRFSLMAVCVVCALLAAGLVLLWLLLGDVPQLWRSVYGRYVSAKLLLVAGLLCCAAYNKWRLTPRLRANDSGAVRSLRASIRLELLLGASILTMTAVLTTVAGPPTLE